MALVYLVTPPALEPQRAPYLGQRYVAAALLAAGHDVRVFDLAAPAGPTAEDLRAALSAAPPALVGFTLFTEGVTRAYDLVARLRTQAGAAADGNAPCLWVAGGPHATACPDETLAHGFDLALAGEAEESLVALLDGRRSAGLSRPGATSETFASAALAGLAAPYTANHLYEARWYGQGGAVEPGVVVTSRGCPGRCVYCANHVTGRRHRFRPTGAVLAELRALRRGWALTHFSFWDDAFTADPDRVRELCRAMLADPELRGVTWTCATPAAFAAPELLAAMRDAGCVAINFGLESGDPAVLREVGRSPRIDVVERAVVSAHDLGLSTVVNVMCGFPGEGLAELGRTRAIMERLAPAVDVFNPRGVLIPYPGTPIYERHHRRFGFTDWWLAPIRDGGVQPGRDAGKVGAPALEFAESDPTLERDFFRYAPDVRAAIEDCVRFKARHNARRFGVGA